MAMKQQTRKGKDTEAAALDEDAFGRRVAACLGVSAHELDDGVSRRLQAARERALLAHRPQAGTLRRLSSALALDGIFQPRVRQAFALIAVVALVSAGDYWASWSRIAELEEIDAALLADELPIDAYLDADFTRWLQQDSRS